MWQNYSFLNVHLKLTPGNLHKLPGENAKTCVTCDKQ